MERRILLKINQNVALSLLDLLRVRDHYKTDRLDGAIRELQQVLCGHAYPEPIDEQYPPTALDEAIAAQCDGLHWTGAHARWRAVPPPPPHPPIPDIPPIFWH